MSRTVTGGRAPGRDRDLRLLLTRPSSSSWRSRSFNSTRVSPFSPKALAISRLEALSGLSEMNSSRTSRGGMAPWMIAGFPLEPVAPEPEVMPRSALSARFRCRCDLMSSSCSSLTYPSSLFSRQSSSPAPSWPPPSSVPPSWSRRQPWQQPSSALPWPFRKRPCHPFR
ncbi:hypothetical protein D3C71_438390 [compost metagenome]